MKQLLILSSLLSILVFAPGESSAQTYSESDVAIAQANGGLRTASLAVQRFFLRTIGLPPLIPRTDSISATYGRVPLDTIVNSRAQPGPAIGSCAVVQMPVPATAPNGPLNAGALSVTGPVGSRTLTMGAPGSYSVTFIPASPFPQPGVITDGTAVTVGSYVLTGTAGTDVGAHNVTINHPATFSWTEYETMASTVTRSQGLPLNWTGGSPGGIVSLTGASLSAPGVGGLFFCLADAAAGTFTVPPDILSALPVSHTEAGFALGSVTVLNVTDAGPFTIPGTDKVSAAAFDGYAVNGVSFR